MRRFWFIVKTSMLGVAPVALVLGIPLAALGALGGGLMAHDSAGTVSTLVGLLLGGAIGLASVVCFLAPFVIPLYTILFVIHFSKTDSIDVRPRRTVLLNISPAKAALVCREAASRVPGASIDELGCTTDRVAASTPLTWESFGEKIRLEIRALPDPNRCEVVVSSRCALPGTVLDYGVNERNVDAAITYLGKNGLLDDGMKNEPAPARENAEDA